jgi:hypothetical protein
MKSKFMLKPAGLCVVILLISFSILDAKASDANTTSEFKPVDPNRIPEILTMISEQVRSNYEKIKTWQGETDVETDFIDEGTEAERIFKERTNSTGEIPKVVKEHKETGHQFAADIEKDFLYSNLYQKIPPVYTDSESGRNLGTKSLRPWFTFSITTPEYSISSMPGTFHGNSIVVRRAVKETRQKGSTCTSGMPPAYDPRETFTTAGGKVWESFPLILQYINEHGKYSFGGYDLKVEESTSGNITKYRIVIPNKAISGEYHFLTKIFSSEAGFNMTSFEVVTEEGKVLLEWKWDYDLIDGVYLPKVTSQRNFTRKDGKLDYEKRRTFKNQKVNKPIPAETFTYKNLGLKDGDEFIDKIAGKEYRYQDANLVFVVDVNK